MRHASIAMSCVADAKATTSANAPNTSEARLRPDRHHRHEADNDSKLREHDPTATLAEPAEHGQLDTVEQGRPDELERVREADPRDEADCRELGAFLAEPRTERVARQKEREAGRETEREHREHTRLA